MGVNLSEQFKELVFHSVKALGAVIKLQYGDEVFDQVEKLRLSMKKLRSTDTNESFAILSHEIKKLKKSSDKNLFKLAHSYSLMLELINRCETAYRSYRLTGQPLELKTKVPYAIIFVFTAHPTEARAESVIKLFDQIEVLLRQSMRDGFESIHEQLNYLLAVLLKLSMANNEKPTVEDEAKYIFSYVLKDEILAEQVLFHTKGLTVNFRTWVGGDKDGHPGVDMKTMKMCFQLTRKNLLRFISNRLLLTKESLLLMSEQDSTLKTLIDLIDDLMKDAQQLLPIKEGDGVKVNLFKNKLAKLNTLHLKKLAICPPALKEIESLVWLYPALVLQIEIREDSEFVHMALEDDKMAIARMLQYLKCISKGLDLKWYVRGFVLSMVESAKDLIAGVKLMRKELGGHKIPVVPLFENQVALVNAVPILKEFFSVEQVTLKTHNSKWSGRFEVMLGYSDSSKENGVFPSRLLIANALSKLDNFLQKMNLTPVFFHGSGGSVERGGGTIKEQTQWWPKSAVNIFKATCQGEMVARNFGNHIVMRAQVKKISDQLVSPRRRLKEGGGRLSIEKFSNLITDEYKKTWDSAEFFELVEKATPYSYLDRLKIGSRPTSRTTGGAKRKLRAIPWVLCWTQARVLFPTWWGVGTAWESINETDKYHILVSYEKSDLLKSFVKILGFTLAKIELSVFKLYLAESTLNPKFQQVYFDKFLSEYEKTMTFFREITRQDQLLFSREWLDESIQFRSPMIHPLNLIQLIALSRKNEVLLRETVTGIACGMLTTG